MPGSQYPRWGAVRGVSGRSDFRDCFSSGHRRPEPDLVFVGSETRRSGFGVELHPDWRPLRTELRGEGQDPLNFRLRRKQLSSFQVGERMSWRCGHVRPKSLDRKASRLNRFSTRKVRKWRPRSSAKAAWCSNSCAAKCWLVWQEVEAESKFSVGGQLRLTRLVRWCWRSWRNWPRWHGCGRFAMSRKCRLQIQDKQSLDHNLKYWVC